MRIRSTAQAPFKKKAIPGPVKVEVVRRYGALPGTTTAVACEYCGWVGSVWWPLTFTGKFGTHVVTSPLEFEHVQPEFFGGKSVASNLVLACRSCNRSKGTKPVASLRSRKAV